MLHAFMHYFIIIYNIESSAYKYNDNKREHVKNASDG